MGFTTGFVSTSPFPPKPVNTLLNYSAARRPHSDLLPPLPDHTRAPHQPVTPTHPPIPTSAAAQLDLRPGPAPAGAADVPDPA